MAARSPPAQNTGPAPDSTATRTSGRSSIERAHAVQVVDQRRVERVAHVGPVERDAFDGAVASNLEMAVGLLVRHVGSHPEHAELRLRNRRVPARPTAPGRARRASAPGRECRRPTAAPSSSRATLRARTSRGWASRIAASSSAVISCCSRAIWSRLTVASTRGRLLAAHHRDARVRPHPEQARLERAAAHPVVARRRTSRR